MIYINALKHMDTQVVLGYFKKTQRVFKDIEGICRKKWVLGQAREEKQTDVSIGVELIRQAYKTNYDLTILISADTDFEPAMKLLRLDFPERKILAVLPIKNRHHSFSKYANQIALVKEKQLRSSQLPESIILSNGTKIYRPPTWR